MARKIKILTEEEKRIEILQESNLLLQQRLYDAEKVAFDNSHAQEELLEILIDMGVI